MGKYLHLFETVNEFMDQYYDMNTARTTSVTTEDGTYEYGGVEYNYETGGRLMVVHVWKKDDNWQNWRVTEYNGSVPTPQVGDILRNYSRYTQYKTITAITTEAREPGYQEPWVSYTEENEHVDYNYEDSFDPIHVDPNPGDIQA